MVAKKYGTVADDEFGTPFLVSLNADTNRVLSCSAGEEIERD